MSTITKVKKAPPTTSFHCRSCLFERAAGDFAKYYRGRPMCLFCKKAFKKGPPKRGPGVNKMAVGYKDSTTPEEIRDLWATPQFVFNHFNKIFNYTMDGAANAVNHKCPIYLTEEDDALTCNWFNHIGGTNNPTVWINPPYSDIGPWVKVAAKYARLGVTTTLFVPNTDDAAWWPRDASEIKRIIGYENPKGRNISGRIQFVRADTGKKQGGNNKGSCLIVFSPFSLGQMVTTYVGIETIMTAEMVAKYDKAEKPRKRKKKA